MRIVALLCLCFAYFYANEYYWTQYNAHNELEFRIVGAQDCPSIRCDDASLETKARFSEDFKVCYANVTHCSSLKYKDKELKTAQKSNKIVIVGDTGCRIKINSKGKGSIQNCDDENAWPAKRVANAISEHKPDLIIHVGDYHYREKCDNKEICDKFNVKPSDVGYGYDIWKKDFFEPFANLSPQAPFIFIRGNHENCDRAWRVYKAALSPYKYAPCGKIDDGSTLALNATENPYELFIGGVKIAAMDTSGDDAEQGYNRDNYMFYLKTFRNHDFNSKILLTHQPFYNLNFKEATSRRKALEYTNTAPLFIAGGDLHIFELMQTAKTTQIISGCGGSSLYDLKLIDDLFLNAKQLHSFGFVVLTKTKDGFDGVFYSQYNEKLLDFTIKR